MSLMINVTGDGNCGIYSLVHNIKIACQQGVFANVDENEYITRLREAYNKTAPHIDNNALFVQCIKQISYTQAENDLTKALRSLIPQAVAAWDKNALQAVQEENCAFPGSNDRDKAAEIKKQSQDKAFLDARVLAALARYLGFSTNFISYDKYSRDELDHISQFSALNVHGPTVFNWQPHFQDNHFSYALPANDANREIYDEIHAQKKKEEEERQYYLKQAKSFSDEKSEFSFEKLLAGIKTFAQDLQAEKARSNNFVISLFSTLVSAVVPILEGVSKIFGLFTKSMPRPAPEPKAAPLKPVVKADPPVDFLNAANAGVADGLNRQGREMLHQYDLSWLESVGLSDMPDNSVIPDNSLPELSTVPSFRDTL